MSELTFKLIPHLACRNAAEAAKFYEKAFGAQVMCILNTPDGKVMHGAIKVGGNDIYLVDEFPDHGCVSPLALGNTPVTLHLQVDDCDAVFNRAVEAGCTVKMPLQEMFWGDRYGHITDPYGHNWSIATTVKQVSMDDIQAAMSNMDVTGCPEPAAV